MNNIRVADNFAPNAEAIREAALHLEFKTIEHGGEKYSGIGISEAPLNLSAEIRELVGFQIRPKLSLFRLNRGGDLPSTFIHADSSESEFAGVLHLTDQNFLRGGTAFWTHRAIGVDRVNQDLTSSAAERFRNDGHDESLWEMTGYCAMKFNRFITYPACMFHSRYPKEPWGVDNSDSRLIWACFYDRA